MFEIALPCADHGTEGHDWVRPCALRLNMRRVFMRRIMEKENKEGDDRKNEIRKPKDWAEVWNGADRVAGWGACSGRWASQHPATQARHVGCRDVSGK
jgi:hypothetical protein